MKDRIHLLPDSVANQIAAGEVIQRPSSVIKELVENAVDAGADDINVIVRDGGKTLIQVIDNGCGMSETDARMAFERHATSKIKSADDLSTLVTMGFRGEALPSICAVAMVEVRTRTEDSPIGTRLVITGSREETQEADMCEKGTNIMVKNLFFNVPARRKFMKSDSVELSSIYREFERLALVNPGVRMRLDTGGKVIDLRKATFRQRIADIWKGNIDSQLIPVEVETGVVKISGYISRPEFARRRNPLQYLLVNGRNMKHPYFSRAVLNCYDSLISPDTKPNFFIKFTVDPASIDVNIHPTKDEIKFEEESLIWSILTAAVKASLGKFAAVPTIDFDTESLPVSGFQSGDGPKKPESDISLDYNPFLIKDKPVADRRQKLEFNGDRGKRNVRNWDKLYDNFFGEKRNVETIPDRTQSVFNWNHEEENIKEVFQFGEKYIVAPTRAGILIVDQYRAHVKILFEQIFSRFRHDVVLSQSLVFPELINFEPTLMVLLEKVAVDLRNLGIKIEREPDGNYYLHGMPAMIDSNENPLVVLEKMLLGLIDDTGENPIEKEEDMNRKVALSLAKSLAVRRGRSLTSEEMEEILSSLFRLPEPSYTPEGRQIFTILDEFSLRKLLP